MNYLFIIISYYFYHNEYYMNSLVFGQHIMYGIHPNYKDNFEYPNECNQTIMVDLDHINYLHQILNMGWDTNEKGFDFWKEEYINRYDYVVNKSEYDYFVNYLILHNEFMNISYDFISLNKEIQSVDDLAALIEEDYAYYFPDKDNIQIYNKINKTKYDKMKINYDMVYLNNYFNYSNQQTIASKNVFEVWKCSI